LLSVARSVLFWSHIYKCLSGPLPSWVLNRKDINSGKDPVFSGFTGKTKASKQKSHPVVKLKTCTDEKHNELHRKSMEDQWYILDCCNSRELAA